MVSFRIALAIISFPTPAFVSSFAGIATIAKPEQVQQALSFFLEDPEAAKVTPTSSGVNNVVQYVETADGKDLILRIYNNGCNTAAVEYEHAILEKIDRSSLPFQVPQYIPSLPAAGTDSVTNSGKTMMELSSGTQCCMCLRIPGVLPKTSDPKPLGRATGQLMKAMEKIHLDLQPPIAPYYRVYDVHKAIGGDKTKFYNYCQGPDFDSCRAGIESLCRALQHIDAAVETMLSQEGKDRLPQQIIHGDLHYDNVLCDAATGDVTGLLDFEFCTMDWRAMEVAVCLSKYVGEEDPFPLVDSFIDGYCEHGELTEAECRGLPDMINLRVLSNCVYFVGRALSGQDTIASLTTRADMYAQRVIWVNENKDRITECVAKRMREKGVF
jgi:homoserine kinase type II